MSINYFN
jgi:phosphate/sulfate permease